MNKLATLSPFPTASGAIGRNQDVPVGGEAKESGAFVYACAIAFSVGAPDNTFDSFLVEDPIDHAAAVRVLGDARQVEEHDFPIGGPFGV